MKKLSENKIETLLREFLSDQTTSKLIGIVLKKCEPKTLTEWEIFSVFDTVHRFVVINPFTNYKKTVISLGIVENVCRYSNNVIIVIDQNSEFQIFHCTVFDYTLKQSVFIFQIK